MKSAPGSSSLRVEKIAVVGAGVVGVPMAALLGRAGVRLGTDSPASVVLVQRNSATSGWKVEAINSGRSPLGGVEPDLDRTVAGSVASGRLRATHDYACLREADVIIICVQTDKAGMSPDYGPLFSAVDEAARALSERRRVEPPLIIFESTLAPSSMNTVIRERFRRRGLREGREVRLAHSPNRVMPGRLLERVVSSDKLVAGLSAGTPELVERLYAKIVKKGRLYPVNCLTAEIVKTLENAYRDVRIAYSAEVARFCDAHDLDFYRVRDEVNRRLSWDDSASDDPQAVPSAGILIPTIGVGGHCLPKDGILLLWRRLQAGWKGHDSLILTARTINDASPLAASLALGKLARRLREKSVTLLGVAYRPNAADARNSPSLALGRILAARGARLRLHDPYLNPNDPNLLRSGLAKSFSSDLTGALSGGQILVFCTAHQYYRDKMELILGSDRALAAVYDGCNLSKPADFRGRGIKHGGVGKGTQRPTRKFVDFVHRGFVAVETGFANELADDIDFLNGRYANRDFDRVSFQEVRRLAATCVTGCRIPDPGAAGEVAALSGFLPRLVRCANRQNRS
jgi:UDP-N-acetyl-D-mannosaminuronic acid dehydrogenase